MNKYILILIITISCNQKEYKPSNEYKIGLAWTQNLQSTELYATKLSIARLNLDSFLSSDKKYNKPLAIITDVDETVLDNSPYDGKLILNNTSYNRESWVIGEIWK